MIQILYPKPGEVSRMGGKQLLEIQVDNADEVAALGLRIDDGVQTFIAATGSIAHTPDHSADWELSPAGTWVKRGGASGPDWNQNDPNAPDYVKGRTHYDNVLAQVVYDGDYSPPSVNESGANTAVATNQHLSYKFVSDIDLPFGSSFATDGNNPDISTAFKLNGDYNGKNAYGIGEVTPERVWEIYTARGDANANLKPQRSVPIWIVVPHEGFTTETVIFGLRQTYYFTKPGVYVVAGMVGADIAATTLTCGETVPLDEKYIPSTIARKSDLEGFVTEARVNELLVAAVAAINGNA